MEHPILFISIILEKLQLPVPHGPVGEGLLEKICSPHMTYTWFVMLFLIVICKLTLSNIELIPGRGQNFWEAIVGGMDEMFKENMGTELTKLFFPMIATFGLFIAVGNLIGLIPGFMSPTANVNTTLALTLIVWLTHHIVGIRSNGLGYIKQFLGPIPIMIPLMFPLEIISNIARILSLSIRLFGNIFAKEVLLGILFAMGGAYFLPLPIMILGVLVSLVQALVFVLLTLVYFNLANEHGH